MTHLDEIHPERGDVEGVAGLDRLREFRDERRWILADLARSNVDGVAWCARCREEVHSEALACHCGWVPEIRIPEDATP